MSQDLGHSSGESKWFEISNKIEGFVKADKKLNANVDFYSASTYHTLGIEVDLLRRYSQSRGLPVGPLMSSSNWTIIV